MLDEMSDIQHLTSRSPVRKELLHQGAALSLEYSLDHLHAMIQKIRVANTEMRFDCARLLISRAVNKYRHAGLNQRARAHRARLDRRINRGVRQPVVTDFRRSLSERDDLGMRGWIAISARAISGDYDQLIAADNTGADGNFVACRRLFRCAQSLAHPPLMLFQLRAMQLR
jgi:hypothetical protein